MLSFHNPSFEETTSKEWLVTNGIGGYASGTSCGANTRRYHGLLVASLNPPVQRQLLVSNMEEYLFIHKEPGIAFSTNQFPGLIHPQGFQYLHRFERNPIPRLVFNIGDRQLAKTIFMVHGSNTTVVEYENLGQSDFQLSLSPLFVDRDYHSLFHENSLFDYYFEQFDECLKIYSHYGTTPLYLRYFAGHFVETRYWVKNLQYIREQQRGLDFQEDAYSIGKFTFRLGPGEKAHMVFSQDEKIIKKNPDLLKSQELNRLKKLSSEKKDTFRRDLETAADQFIVRRASTNSYSILAGYHWFTDWGRDTMIAMRGLTIARGKRKMSKSILRTFFDSIDKGMLPNRFPDYVGEKVEYNTIDATLWLFVALYEHYRKFGDKTFIAQNFDKLSDIILWHLKGTRHHVHVTNEGFLYGGLGKDQLTWMDAKIGNHVVTPRHGCPVEVQALWYNALKIYQFFALEIQHSRNKSLLDQCDTVCKKIMETFSVYFFNEAGYLNDVVIPGTYIDASIRPNQIYALSLPFSLLPKEQEKQVIDTVIKHLFTPFGLRTLSPDHQDFRPVYEGDQWKRDTAYHQGTVWPFLLGDFFAAMLKIQDDLSETRQQIVTSVNVLSEHFYHDGCIHGISEIFDGLDPGEGKGAIQQAWSVGALLMVYAAMDH